VPIVSLYFQLVSLINLIYLVEIKMGNANSFNLMWLATGEIENNQENQVCFQSLKSAKPSAERFAEQSSFKKDMALSFSV